MNGKGLIFNIQRFSLHDGPGIRTTVFMKGCPLRCKWCSNPESIKGHPEIMYHSIKCVGSKRCLEACPLGAIEILEHTLKIDRTKCNLCMDCVKACPSGAMECVGSYVAIDEVIEEVEKDRLFYQNSGGGVTISGGEPLFQWEFVRDLLRQCKEKGLHTALDTSGHASWQRLEQVLEYVDLVLYDIKCLDPALHREGTGVSNELILSNAEKTARRVRTWLRAPVIPGFNDSPTYIKELAGFSSTMPFEKISLLPYHVWGEPKYEKLALEYPFKGTPLPNDEQIQELKGIIESFGLQVTIGR